MDRRRLMPNSVTMNACVSIGTEKSAEVKHFEVARPEVCDRVVPRNGRRRQIDVGDVGGGTVSPPSEDRVVPASGQGDRVPGGEMEYVRARDDSGALRLRLQRLLDIVDELESPEPLVLSGHLLRLLPVQQNRTVTALRSQFS